MVVVWADQFRVRKHFIRFLSKKVLFLFKEKKNFYIIATDSMLLNNLSGVMSKYLSNAGIFISFQTITFSSLTYS